jgi:RNA polymerase sigma factor (sigma-70 family)
MTREESKHIGKVYEQEKDGLLRFINRRTRNRSDAEDILQDVFFQLTTGFREIRLLGSLSAWLYRVARNRITDYYRKHKPTLVSDFGKEDAPGLADYLTIAAENPETRMIREEAWELIFDVLGQLPENQRQVFVWHELEDLSFKEMAELSGEPVNTLLSRKRYAILSLKEKLFEYKPNK